MKYRQLTQQDIIQEDDEYRTNWGSWVQIESEYVGIRKGAILGWYVRMRRPLHNHPLNSESAKSLYSWRIL